VLAEDHPDRLVSERLLAAFHQDWLKRSEPRQASASSIEDIVAGDKDGCQFNQAPDVSQARSENSVAITAMSDQSPADQKQKSNGVLTGRLLVRRLKSILKKGK
jgi:hypothetical protein